MKRSGIMLKRLRALSAVAALGLTACGGDESADFDFSDVEVTVGSKNFNEQYVLSEIFIQALEHHGATVTNAVDTGDTPETRAALEAGEIDAYFEYNSTGWTVHLGEAAAPSDDGEELTDLVREADAANGIEWVGRSSFNNTYGFAMPPDVADDNQASRYSVEKFNLDAMAEALERDGDLSVCMEADFETRDDGYPLFVEATDFEIPDDQLMVVDDQMAVYAAAAAGECDFLEVFTTDGGIEELDLTLVVDPGVFYIYNASLTISEEVYQQAPDAFDGVVDDILGTMTQSRMTELNGRVAAGEDPAAVAADYLEEFVK